MKKIKFFVEVEGKIFPFNLNEVLYAAATSGARNGDMYSGFTYYEVTPEGIIFFHLPNWQEKLLIKWDGERVKLPMSEES
jgi:hypothetical protein